MFTCYILPKTLSQSLLFVYRKSYISLASHSTSPSSNFNLPWKTYFTLYPLQPHRAPDPFQIHLAFAYSGTSVNTLPVWSNVSLPSQNIVCSAKYKSKDTYEESSLILSLRINHSTPCFPWHILYLSHGLRLTLPY